jgi:hypothetical protein
VRHVLSEWHEEALGRRGEAAGRIRSVAGRSSPECREESMERLQADDGAAWTSDDGEVAQGSENPSEWAATQALGDGALPHPSTTAMMQARGSDG